jgi:hypothetical protein
LSASRTKEMAQASPPARQRLEGGRAREVPRQLFLQ